MIRSVVRGFGTALPKRVLTNAELESMVDTSDDWIVQRTGIRQRYIAGEGETTASLGEAAARAVLLDVRAAVVVHVDPARHRREALAAHAVLHAGQYWLLVGRGSIARRITATATLATGHGEAD